MSIPATERKTERTAEELYADLVAAGAILKVWLGRLFVSPKEIAMRFADQITTHKPELHRIVHSAQIDAKIEKLKQGICPECDYTLDLQSRNHGGWWNCANCRKQFVMEKYENQERRKVQS